jgi:hypothetical protein
MEIWLGHQENFNGFATRQENFNGSELKQVGQSPTCTFEYPEFCLDPP